MNPLALFSLLPLAIAVAVFWLLFRPREERVEVEYVDVRGRRRRVRL